MRKTFCAVAIVGPLFGGVAPVSAQIATGPIKTWETHPCETTQVMLMRLEGYRPVAGGGRTVERTIKDHYSLWLNDGFWVVVATLKDQMCVVHYGIFWDDFDPDGKLWANIPWAKHVKGR